MASPITATPLPLYTAIPDVPADLSNAVNNLEKFAVPRYASTAARDTAIPSPVAGMLCYVTGVGFLKNTTGTTGGWVALYTIPSVPAMNTGFITVSIAANASSGTATITFATGRFAAAPNVFVQINSGASVAVRTGNLIYSISATSCTVGAYLTSTPATQTNLDHMWLATDRGF